MIYEEVTLEKNFQVGEFLFEKAIIKGKLEPGETIAEALNAAKSEAVEWFNKSNPHLARPIPQQMGPAIGIDPYRHASPLAEIRQEYINPEDTIAAIESCKDLKVLESYKLIAKLYPDYQEAYDTMYQKLSK